MKYTAVCGVKTEIVQHVFKKVHQVSLLPTYIKFLGDVVPLRIYH
jgi:hypothetical protein